MGQKQAKKWQLWWILPWKSPYFSHPLHLRWVQFYPLVFKRGIWGLEGVITLLYERGIWDLKSVKTLMWLHLQGWECLWSGYISYNMLQLRGHLCIMPQNPLDKRSIWEGGLWVIMHSWPLSSGDFKSGNLGTSFPCRWRWSVHPWTFSAIWTTLMISKRKIECIPNWVA